MDQKTIVTPELREQIYEQLADAMTTALEHAEVTTRDASLSSDMILKNLDNARTYGELLTFLHQLSARWDIYQTVYQEAMKEELLKKVSDELKSFTTTP